jgi:hypothetical protein
VVGKIDLWPNAYRIVPGSPSFGYVLAQLSAKEATSEFASNYNSNRDYFKSKLQKCKGKAHLMSIARAQTFIAPAVLQLWIPDKIWQNRSMYSVVPIRIDLWAAIAPAIPLSSFEKK